MKKALKSISAVLLAGAMLFNFAACSSDDDGGNDDGGNSKTAKLPKSETANNLSGNTFVYEDEDDGETVTYKFDSSTFTLTEEEKESEGSFTVAYTDKTESKYKYTVDSDLGVLYATKTSETNVFIDENGKTLYKRPSSYPSSFAAWKKSYTDMMKATAKPEIKPALELALDTYFQQFFGQIVYGTFYRYGYEDETGATEVSSAIYDKYLADLKKTEKAPVAVEMYAYNVSDSTLKVAKLSTSKVPAGTKFGSIFNDYYKFSARGANQFGIYVNSTTFIDYNPGITCPDVSSGGFKILSAKDDSMVITEVTGVKEDENGDTYIVYDKANKITLPITYEEGEDKVTAKIVLNENEYTFDINYITKDYVESELRWNAHELTKKAAETK